MSYEVKYWFEKVDDGKHQRESSKYQHLVGGGAPFRRIQELTCVCDHPLS